MMQRVGRLAGCRPGGCRDSDAVDSSCWDSIVGGIHTAGCSCSCFTVSLAAACKAAGTRHRSWPLFIVYMLHGSRTHHVQVACMPVQHTCAWNQLLPPQVCKSRPMPSSHRPPPSTDPMHMEVACMLMQLTCTWDQLPSQVCKSRPMPSSHRPPLSTHPAAAGKQSTAAPHSRSLPPSLRSAAAPAVAAC